MRDAKKKVGDTTTHVIDGIVVCEGVVYTITML